MAVGENCCSVCGNSDITHMHFGSRVCQACAAFFRRTVSLGIRFVCKFEKNCKISMGERIICRSCRFEKCEAVGMKRDLVQEPRVTSRIPKYVQRSRDEGVEDIIRVYASGGQKKNEGLEVNTILNVNDEELLEYYVDQVRTSSRHQEQGLSEFSLPNLLRRKQVADFYAFQICSTCPGTDLLEKDDLSVLFRYCSFANLWIDSAFQHRSKDIEHSQAPPILSQFMTSFESTVTRSLDRLKMETEEYAALKSYCIWKLAMLESTITLRTVAQEQYSTVTAALCSHYKKTTSMCESEIATRLAQLILLITPIFDAYREVLVVYEQLGIANFTDIFEKQVLNK